jgi:GH15 family glucan-1,4-alpha-glucosidase
MCWVAADRGTRRAAGRGERGLAARWHTARQDPGRGVCANGIDDRGVFVQHYGGTALDASALLIPLMGFLPPGDERVRSTMLAIAGELSSDGLVSGRHLGNFPQAFTHLALIDEARRVIAAGQDGR